MELERAELQDSVRRVLAAGGLAAPTDQARATMVEMGWLGLTAPEALGGLDQAPSALWTVYVELGRALARAPFLPGMLAIQALVAAEDFAGREAWIGRLIDGEPVTAPLDAERVTLARDEAGWRVSGVLRAAMDVDRAAHLLFWTPGGELCALTPLEQEGVELQACETWDETRPLHDIRLDRLRIAPADVLASGEGGVALCEALQVHALTAIAADCVGAAQACLETTVEYLNTRTQFSRPLAMFQALKHRCADLKARLAASEALLWDERHAGEAGPAAVVRAGALKALAATDFQAMAEEAVQLHGGIGMTCEHTCHLFLKRALLNTVLAGEVDDLDLAAGSLWMQRLAAA